MRFSLLVVLAFLFAAVSAPTFAGESRYLSQKGAWILNKAESKIPAGSFTPRDTPIVVTVDDGTALNFIAYDMTGTGLQPGISYEGKYDGTFFPYGNDAERSFTRVSPSSFRSITQSPEGWSFNELISISGDGRKMRAEGKYVGKDGKTYDYIQVWDKLE